MVIKYTIHVDPQNEDYLVIRTDKPLVCEEAREETAESIVHTFCNLERCAIHADVIAVYKSSLVSWDDILPALERALHIIAGREIEEVPIF